MIRYIFASIIFTFLTLAIHTNDANATVSMGDHGGGGKCTSEKTVDYPQAESEFCGSRATPGPMEECDEIAGAAECGLDSAKGTCNKCLLKCTCWSKKGYAKKAKRGTVVTSEKQCFVVKKDNSDPFGGPKGKEGKWVTKKGSQQTKEVCCIPKSGYDVDDPKDPAKLWVKRGKKKYKRGQCVASCDEINVQEQCEEICSEGLGVGADEKGVIRCVEPGDQEDIPNRCPCGGAAAGPAAPSTPMPGGGAPGGPSTPSPSGPSTPFGGGPAGPTTGCKTDNDCGDYCCIDGGCNDCPIPPGGSGNGPGGPTTGCRSDAECGEYCCILGSCNTCPHPDDVFDGNDSKAPQGGDILKLLLERSKNGTKSNSNAYEGMLD